MDSRAQEWCPEYVTTSFVAECCGVSKVTVLDWIGERRLVAFRLPKGHYRIYRDDLVNFMNEYGIPFHLKRR